jgi:hypothetical protein
MAERARKLVAVEEQFLEDSSPNDGLLSTPGQSLVLRAVPYQFRQRSVTSSSLSYRFKRKVPLVPPFRSIAREWAAALSDLTQEDTWIGAVGTPASRLPHFPDWKWRGATVNKKLQQPSRRVMLRPVPTIYCL